jgi:hypothetical protein
VDVTIASSTTSRIRQNASTLLIREAAGNNVPTVRVGRAR